MSKAKNRGKRTSNFIKRKISKLKENFKKKKIR